MEQGCEQARGRYVWLCHSAARGGLGPGQLCITVRQPGAVQRGGMDTFLLGPQGHSEALFPLGLS